MWTKNSAGLYELPAIPPEMRRAGVSDDDLELLFAKFPSMPRSTSQCVTCQGRRRFRWWVYFSEDNSRVEAHDYVCHCPSQWTLLTCFMRANIGIRYQRLSWRDAAAVEAHARDSVLDYLSSAEDYVRSGAGFIFHGSGGNGKTLLSSLLLKGLIAQGYDGYWTTFPEMIDTYTGGWHSPEVKKIFHNRVLNSRILILDDVGKEWKRKGLELTEATFDAVLRHRVHNALPTIITTNLPMEDLGRGYGSSVLSLLSETCTPVAMTGSSFRESANARLMAEIEAGLTRPIVVG